ncbi:MAG: hypothetical protein AAB131_05340, partial [Actinomycetota bacterium]
RGGIRAGVAGGIRAGAPSGARGASHRQEPQDEPISLRAGFFLPKHLAREGDNTVRARVRSRDKPAAKFVEVKTKVTVNGTDDPAHLEVLDRDIPLDEVILSDSDGDGVATLLETVSLGLDAALARKGLPR